LLNTPENQAKLNKDYYYEFHFVINNNYNNNLYKIQILFNLKN